MSLSFARGWKFDQFQTQIPTTRDNMQQGVQTGQYKRANNKRANNVASVCTGIYFTNYAQRKTRNKE